MSPKKGVIFIRDSLFLFSSAGTLSVNRKVEHRRNKKPDKIHLTIKV